LVLKRPPGAADRQKATGSGGWREFVSFALGAGQA